MDWEIAGKILSFIVIVLIPFLWKLWKAKKEGKNWAAVGQIAIAGLSHVLAKLPGSEQEEVKNELKRIQTDAGVHDLTAKTIADHAETRKNSPEFEIGVDVDEKGKVLGGAKLRIPF